MKRKVFILPALLLTLVGCGRKEQQKQAVTLTYVDSIDSAFTSADAQAMFETSYYSTDVEFNTLDTFLTGIKGTFVEDIINGTITILSVREIDGAVIATDMDNNTYELYIDGTSWFIDDIPLNTFDFTVLADSTVNLNGIPVASFYEVESDDEALTAYSIEDLLDGEYEITISNGEEEEDIVKTISDFSKPYNFVMSEEEQSYLVDKTEEMINLYYQGIEKDSASYLDIAYLFHTDMKKNYLKDLFNESILMLNKSNQFSRYYDISVEDITLNDEIIIIDGNTVTLPLHLIIKWTIGDGSLTGRTEEDTEITLSKDIKKEWVIKDISDTSFITSLNYLKGVDE